MVAGLVLSKPAILGPGFSKSVVAFSGDVILVDVSANRKPPHLQLDLISLSFGSANPWLKPELPFGKGSGVPEA